MEALQLEYDESQVCYEDLLKAFLQWHRPNTLGKKQYRSAIMFHSQEQKETAERILQQGRVPSTDLLQPAASWHDAEEYHQKYAQKQVGMFGD